MKWEVVAVLFLGAAVCSAAEEKYFELTPQDGWFNNLIHPDWGGIDGQLLRKSPPAYNDGVYAPADRDRPNPFDISRIAHHGLPGQGSERGRNALMVYFGQQVVEEMLDAQRPGCPREYYSIPVPKDHAYNVDNSDTFEMPVLRSRYDQRTGFSPNNPRQQLNEITPYLDGGLFYGTSKAWTDAIREFKGGRLLARDSEAAIKDSFPADNGIRLPMANPPPPRDHELKPVSRFWLLGNPRGNENPFLLAFGVLWFRWHNLVANELAQSHPEDDDETLFNEARKRVIAHHQKIVMYDWLPSFLHRSEDNSTSTCQFCDVPVYTGYDSNKHPGIVQEFQTAAMRFGHTLVTPGVWIRDTQDMTQCKFKQLNLNIPGQPSTVHALRLCNSYFSPQEFVEEDMDGIMLGMAATLAEREDHIMVPDLREHLFGPLEFSRRDLAAINIQRGREHGLLDYNTIREYYGLPRKTSWETINTDNRRPDTRQAIQKLKDLYGNSSEPDNLDLFTGGLLETTSDGPGELFRAIILDQFLNVRDGDRFWFENAANGLFTTEDIRDIRQNITLYDIILKVTGIRDDALQKDVFISSASDQCQQPAQLIADSNVTVNGTNVFQIEQCTPLQHFDYFDNSRVSFALTFLFVGLCIPGTFGVMFFMAYLRKRKMEASRRQRAPRQKSEDPNSFQAIEWMGPKIGERTVIVKFDRGRKKIHVTERGRKPLRMIDLRYTDKIHLRTATDSAETLLSVRVPGEIDLVLRFDDMLARTAFVGALEGFIKDISVTREDHPFSESVIFKEADTKEERDKLLDKFFRVICMQVFKKNPGDVNLQGMKPEDAARVTKIKLTRTEFAEALGMKPNSIFIRNMFLLVDRDKDNFVSFQEFMDMFIVLSSSDGEDKARLIFNMYDTKKRGFLSRDDFAKMIRSLLDLSDASLQEGQVNEFIKTMYAEVGITESDTMNFNKFKMIFNDHESTLNAATLNLNAVPMSGQKGHPSSKSERRNTFVTDLTREMSSKTKPTRTSRVSVHTTTTAFPTSKIQERVLAVTRYLENYRLQIFWVTLYTLVTLGIFVERAYFYSFEREHGGLRRIAGYGVTVTRGAASVMMWAYATLLVTMSRNTITFLRETIFHRFIPFDSAVAMHKYIAAVALLATLMHIIGHAINLYHVCTQTASDIICIFREYFRATHEFASFHYWAFGTITGITGVFLTIICVVMYVFALPYARRNTFKAFWFTHSWYWFLYMFMMMHGWGRLVQSPLTHYYLIGPLVLFVLDKLVSISRKKVEIRVRKAEILPSDVIALVFKRPLNFEYLSGQWVRVACVKLGSGEYHPFTLTSAPHEENLSLHIRAVGPWTNNLRHVYDVAHQDGKPLPMLYLDGPYGEGHQDWYKFEVAVLVGGGIGVTPFASILKDIVAKSRMGVKFHCQKVYFLWVTRTQKQFEWLTDIIREVENADTANLVSVHIFITQFQQKFDLRTTMLYICERHFQKVAGKSLFTGLSAMTHFGRPQFKDFLRSLRDEHPKIRNVGVFSCGPPPMTLTVDHACTAINRYENYPTYTHHFENF